jgi:hypothetical protein
MTREEQQAILMRASRILTPIQSALGTIKIQQGRSEKALSTEEFDRHFEVASNTAFLSLFVAKSLELGLTLEEMQHNVAAIYKRHMDVIQSQQRSGKKPDGG